ncbi:MAG: hypothetical protein J5831_03150 [Bacteroidales bacterium]|nr:hypothetical protein [Bacteroidales bacterium]
MMEQHDNQFDLPSSVFIEKRLREFNDRKRKNAFLESIMTDPRASTLYETNGRKTTLFPKSNGPRTSTWRQTKKMAIDLNKAGIDVAFLPEVNSLICADSLLKIRNTYRLADFKYCVTTNPNTLAKELEHGFQQASTLVLKLENMDAGVFKDAISYLERNKKPFGDILLINSRGKTLIIKYKELISNKYARKIKGFL